MASITCVGLGEVLWDILPSGPRLGGAPANFTFHAFQAGLDAQAVSAVGNDQRGQEAQQILKDAGVKSHIFVTEYITGYVKASLDDHGVPTYDFALNTAYDHIPMSDELVKIAQNTQVCCFGTLAQRQQDGTSRQAIYSFLDHMPADSIKVFDINLRQNFYNADVITQSLKRSNVFKCNDEELPIVCKLLGKDVLPIEEFVAFLSQEFGIKSVIYTCGEHGSHIYYNGEHSFQETPKVTVADTVGAGDSFTATFVALTAQGVNFKVAHALAVKVAAFVCTQNGAMPKLTPELKAQLEQAIANK